MNEFNSQEARKYAGGPPYEFTPAQNEVIGALGHAMKWVALPAFALASLGLFYLIMQIVWMAKTGAYKDWQVVGVALFLLANVILYFAFARWTMTASVGFRAIVETRGYDMSFLMLALDNLRMLYRILSLFVKAFIIVSLVGLVMSVIQVYRGEKWPEMKLPEVTVTTPAK